MFQLGNTNLFKIVCRFVLVFIPLLCSYPLGSCHLVGSVMCRFIDFIVVNCGSLLYLLTLFFLLGVTLPLFAFDKIASITAVKTEATDDVGTPQWRQIPRASL